jgi:hypothetical protein
VDYSKKKRKRQQVEEEEQQQQEQEQNENKTKKDTNKNLGSSFFTYRYVDEQGVIRKVSMERNRLEPVGVDGHSPNIFNGIKSLLFTKAAHDIDSTMLVNIYNLFEVDVEMRNRWPLLSRVINFMFCNLVKKGDIQLGAVGGTTDPTCLYVNIPDHVLPPEEFPYPNYLLFYPFIAYENRKVNEYWPDFFLTLFVSITTRVKRTMHLSGSKFRYRSELPDGFMDLRQRYKNFQVPPPLCQEKENLASHTNLCTLFEHLEQKSVIPFASEKDLTIAPPPPPMTIEYKRLPKMKIVYPEVTLDESETMRWVPIKYEIASRQRHVPIFFRPDNRWPVFFDQVLPLWKSEFQQTMPTNARQLRESSTEKSSPNAIPDMRPLVGSHPLFLTLIHTLPCNGPGPIQLLIKKYQ